MEDFNYGLLFIIILGALFVGSILMNLWEWFEYKYQRYKWIKKERFQVSINYIVGWPSGEVIFIDEKEIFDLLQNKKLILWKFENKCYLYKDYDRNYIKRILKFKQG